MLACEFFDKRFYYEFLVFLVTGIDFGVYYYAAAAAGYNYLVELNVLIRL